MVQDIYPHIYRNEFAQRAASDEDLILAYRDEKLLLAATEELRLPTAAQLECRPEALQYLFSIDGQGCFLLEDDGPEPPEGFSYLDSPGYRERRPMETLFACGVGESLRRWYRTNRFCGGCGAAMAKSGRERAMVCPICGNTVYPKICPAVIVAVCDGDRLLLTKYAGRAFTRYALVAGFAEIGESIEDTVRREVMEEVGLVVDELRFYKSQPWIFTDTLLMGFYARLHGSDQVRLQEDELSVGQWFRRADLPDDHNGISLTGEMIEVFRAGYDPFSP